MKIEINPSNAAISAASAYLRATEKFWLDRNDRILKGEANDDPCVQAFARFEREIREIQTGTPTQGGRYACYLPGVGLATVVRLFIIGHGWCDNLHEKISGDVAGWIGPLPPWPENSVSHRPQEFDL